MCIFFSSFKLVQTFCPDLNSTGRDRKLDKAGEILFREPRTPRRANETRTHDASHVTIGPTQLDKAGFRFWVIITTQPLFCGHEGRPLPFTRTHRNLPKGRTEPFERKEHSASHERTSLLRTRQQPPPLQRPKLGGPTWQSLPIRPRQLPDVDCSETPRS